MSIVDLLHVPLALPGVGEQGDGSIGAPTGQDEAVVMGGPAHRIYCRKEGGTVSKLSLSRFTILLNF